ncbi:AMP-binding protein, partial [Desulfovibrio sp. OttesenSCG-928-G15]|nr:AMP-binding protein [Desulfovibrio sp. OttesenSCG-928-G15]
MIASCHEMISRVASRLPEKVALEFEGKTLTYAALETRAQAIAAALLAQGTRRGDIVPVRLPRGTDALVAMLGIWKAGAAPACIHEEYPQERVNFICSECSAKLVLDSSWLATFLPDAQNDQLGAGAPSMFSPSPEDLGLIVFTSGSTGRPKGVMLPHRALARAVCGALPDRRENDVFLSCFAFSFVAVLADAIAPLAAGATLHIASDATRKDVSRLTEYVTAHGITAIFVPVPVAPLLLEAAGSSLRVLFTGSERVERV